MIAIKCEMCGGSELVKRGDLLVCQYCHTKYSTQDVQRFIVEGTVKIDRSDRLQNLFVLARRARNQGDVKDAAKYYGMILLEDANSWEACFYSEYFDTMSTDINDIPNAISRLSHILPEVFRLVRSQISDPEQLQYTISEINHGVIALGHQMQSAARQRFNIQDQSSVRYSSDCLNALKNTYYNLGDQIAPLQDLNALLAWHEGIQVQIVQQGLSSDASRRAIKEQINFYTNRIRQYDSSYNPYQINYVPRYNPPADPGSMPPGQRMHSKPSNVSWSSGQSVVRPGMRVGAIICLIFAVIYLLMAFATPYTWTAVIFFASLCFIFAVLARTPKEARHVTLPGLNKQVGKRAFVILTLIISFIVSAAIMPSLPS